MPVNAGPVLDGGLFVVQRYYCFALFSIRLCLIIGGNMQVHKAVDAGMSFRFWRWTWNLESRSRMKISVPD